MVVTEIPVQEFFESQHEPVMHFIESGVAVASVWGQG